MWARMGALLRRARDKREARAITTETRASVPDTRPLADWLRVVEATNAEAADMAGKLFQTKFGHPIPDYPRHFVLQYAPTASAIFAVGYVHYLAFESSWLCGGMCVDSAAMRKMPREHLTALRAVGGLAEFMLRESFQQIGPCPAIFGHVGEPAARIVDLRAGFVDTEVPRLMVVWRDALEHEKADLVRRVAAFGAF